MRKKLTNGLVSVLVSAMVMTLLPWNLMTAKATETQEAIGAVESVSDADVGTYTTLEDVVFNIEEDCVEITEPGQYYIYGEGNETKNSITIDTEGDVELIIEDVKIIFPEHEISSIMVKNGTLNLILKGENILIGRGGPGISCNGNKIVIDGDGSLKATGIGGISAREIVIDGGNIEAYTESGSAAAIGGYNTQSHVESITINGGNIKAYCNNEETSGGISKAGGVGIGAYSCETITINGGVIESYGGTGPGIGGKKNVKEIIITGGDITAVGGDHSAGIGCGGAHPHGTEDGTASRVDSIIISGGNVIAKGAGFGGKWLGAGIGGGQYADVGIIKIEGGVIEAYGSEGGAGIGTGMSGTCEQLQISDGTILAYAGEYSAAIGMGGYDCMVDGYEKNSFINKLSIMGGNISIRAYKFLSVGIGADLVGCSGGVNNLKISGGTIVCESSEYNNDIACDGAEEIIITGGSVYAKDIKHPVVDENGEALYQYPIYVGEEYQNCEVTQINNSEYGIKDVIVNQMGYVPVYFTENQIPRIYVKENWYTIKKTSISQAKVILDRYGYTYNGYAKKPNVTVKLGDETLKKDTDYSISYKSNKLAGIATVIVTGKVKYIGTASETFRIETAYIRKAKIELGTASYTYDGSAKKPSVIVTLRDKKLKRNTDYTVSYKSNKSAGTATVTVAGTGNYYGTISTTFKITPASLAKAKVQLSAASYTYDGSAKKPDVIVTLGDKTLKKDTDYTISYKDNKNIGKAKVTIKGKGNYTGKVEKNFTITVKKGTSITVEGMKYKVTDAASKKVTFVGISDKSKTSVKIPSTIKYGKVNFKVVSLADNVLKDNTKVEKVLIGTNVTSIGKKAFYGCGNLKTIEFKSEKLNKVGNNAFKGIDSKAKIKVPLSKFKEYKDLLKKKGLGNKVKIIK